MLDGDPMTSWISGCRLKKYHTPLTQKILNRLHATKEQNKQKEVIKAQAQVEAKEQHAKSLEGLKETSKKSQNLLIDYKYVPSMNRITQTLHSDLHSDGVNSLSYKAWEAINKPTLFKPTTTITSFVGETNIVEGYLDLPLFIRNTNVHHRFYVIKPGKVMTPIILGQPWQWAYNGVPKFQLEKRGNQCKTLPSRPQ